METTVPNPAIIRRTPLFPGGLVAALCCALWVLVAATPSHAANPKPTQPVHTYSLTNNVMAIINTDGSLVIGTEAGAVPLLSAGLMSLANDKRLQHDSSRSFSTVVAEGAAAGQRGFSAHRDDDGDGAVDEDPLDGRDNDGDGRIDEDFAAISDAMVVVHRDGRRGAGRVSHLEYYHWSYPHLRSTVFLAAKGSQGPGSGGIYRLVLGDHSWHEATLVGTRHSLAGKAEATRVEGYVAQPSLLGAAASPACGAGAGRWVGVAVLSSTVGNPVALAGGVLELLLAEDATAVAICVADSWLELNTMLNEAVRVHDGVVDSITGRRAPWIAPPLCARCRLSAAPDFRFRPTRGGGLILDAKIASERGVAIDPDLFQVAGLALGAPSEIQWRAAVGSPVQINWTCMNSTLLDSPHDKLSDPYGQLPGLLSHGAEGELRFVFTTDPGITTISAADRLQGRYLDGRAFTAKLEASPELRGPSPSPRVENQRAQLSPKLLEGFPNPFSESIQLRFTVPATIGEAFVWGEGQDPPRGTNLQAAVPWQNGTPTVSVRIYSLNGQELVTLFSASQGPGGGVVQWDGTDNYGRQVAAGTYFCKLQMDKYSITRRLVYLR